MYKITDETIKAMIDECPEAEKVLRKGFPEAFKERWVLVDPSRISVRISRWPGTIFYVQVDGEDVACIVYLKLVLLPEKLRDFYISNHDDALGFIGSSINFIYEKK